MDILDRGSVIRTLSLYKPREIYNLAAQSFVGVSFEELWQPLNNRTSSDKSAGGNKDRRSPD